MNKGPNPQRYMYLLEKLSDIAQDENHDNLIPALTGLLCQIAADSGHDKKMVLAYFAQTLDNEYEEKEHKGEN